MRYDCLRAAKVPKTNRPLLKPAIMRPAVKSPRIASQPDLSKPTIDLGASADLCGGGFQVGTSKSGISKRGGGGKTTPSL